MADLTVMLSIKTLPLAELSKKLVQQFWLQNSSNTIYQWLHIILHWPVFVSFFMHQQLYHQERVPKSPLDRRLNRPKDNLDTVVERKISVSAGNRTLVIQPIISHFNDCTIVAYKVLSLLWAQIRQTFSGI
jgi:1-acyl-sn-glycerol-3-phosphate acyltransferase